MRTGKTGEEGASVPKKKRSGVKRATAAKRNAAPKRKPAAKRKAAPQAARAPSGSAYERGKWGAAFAPRAPGEKRYWLVKSEPTVFSFDDLLRAPSRTTCWDGVRNFAARNFLRDGMKLGDRAFFYHSSVEPQGIAGICEVVREGYPDPTAPVPAPPGGDDASSPGVPAWFAVDLRAVAQFTRAVTLAEMKSRPQLANMALIRVGRLSVTPVSATEWEAIIRLAG